MKLVAAICMAPPGSIETLHVSMWHLDLDLDEAAISAVQGIVAHTTHLQCLGLHGLQIGDKQLPALHQLFAECPDSLEKLVFSDCGRTVAGVLEMNSFFVAVAQVHGLRELYMADWTVLADKQAKACEPLRSIPGLKIFVPLSELNCSYCQQYFPDGLSYHACLIDLSAPSCVAHEVPYTPQPNMHGAFEAMAP